MNNLDIHKKVGQFDLLVAQRAVVGDLVVAKSQGDSAIVSISFTGPYAAPVSVDFAFSRMGDYVFMSMINDLSGAFSSFAAGFTATTPIPQEFMPKVGTTPPYQPIIYFDTTFPNALITYIDSTGIIHFDAIFSGGIFGPGPGNVGVKTYSYMYLGN